MTKEDFFLFAKTCPYDEGVFVFQEVCFALFPCLGCLEDLKELKNRGVKIFTCGTCLNYYELSDKLAVGEVTNMYDIAEKMAAASLIVSP